MTLDPLRLLDGDELTPDERRALGADHTEPSPAGAKRAIWAALSLQLAAPATAAAATLATAAPTAASGASAVATASTITAVALVKSATIGVALGAVVGTGLYFGGRSETPRPAPSVVQRAEQGQLGATGVAAPFHAAPPPVVAPPSAAASDSAPPAAETAPTLARPAPRADVASAERLPAPVPVADESRRVAAARAALRSGNASTALAQLDALALDEPHGLLVQEREALVVEALAVLGRLDAARARADAFLARYPRSPHSAAVRRAAGYAP